MASLLKTLGFYRLLDKNGTNKTLLAGGFYFLLINIVGCKSSVDKYDPKYYQLIDSNGMEHLSVYKRKEDTASVMLKYYWDNGKVQAISFFYKGKKEGPWRAYSENGKLSSESFFLNGLHDSVHKTYHDNGKVLTIGRYRMGQKIGAWESFDTNGIKKDSIFFEN